MNNLNLNYDGHGVNDLNQPFAPRIATLKEEYKQTGVGELLASAPELLEALEHITKLAENLREKLEQEAGDKYDIPNGHFNKAYLAMAKARKSEKDNLTTWEIVKNEND